MFATGGLMAPLYYFFLLLAIAAFVVEAWAFVDALRRPTGAFVAAGKQTKPIWLIILGVAAVVGLGTGVIASTGGGLALIGILPIAAFVAAAIYLTDVRPKIKGFSGGSGGGTRMGPYGPW